MTAPPIVIKTNALHGSTVTIGDMGVVVPPSGGQVELNDDRSVESAAQSLDLRDLCTDDAYGAGSSTLILNDGTADIDQADIEDFLDTRRTDSGAAYKIEHLSTDWPDGKLAQTSGGGLIPVDPGSGGSSVPTYYFDGYDAVGGIVVDAAGVDIPLTNEREKDSIFTHAGGSAEVEVSDNSKYLVLARATVDVQYSPPGGAARSESVMELYIDKGSGYVVLPGSEGVMYNRIRRKGATTCTAVGVVEMLSGHKIKMRARQTQGTSTLQTRANGSSLVLVRIGSGLQAEAFTVRGARRNNATNIYLWAEGVPMNLSGVVLPFSADLIAIGAATQDPETWTAEVRKRGDPTPLGTLSISSARSGYTVLSPVTVGAGEEIQLYCNGSLVGWPVVVAYFERRT